MKPYLMLSAVIISTAVTLLINLPSSVTGHLILDSLNVIAITDSQCSACSNLSNHLSLLDSFGLTYSFDDFDVMGDYGSDLIYDYKITQIPAIIIKGLNENHGELYQFYSLLGTFEDDGAYVFRSADLVLDFVYERVTPFGDLFIVNYSTADFSSFNKKGALDSTFNIIMFGDFECDYSRESKQVIDEILVTYSDVSFTFIPYPLSTSCNDFIADSLFNNSCFYIYSLECAGESGYYWLMLDSLMSGEITSPINVIENIIELGVSIEDFESCVNSDEMRERVNYIVGLGNSLDIRGTPTFYINEMKLLGPFNFDYFTQLHDSE